jgi:predicted restriction endonuclease
MLEKYIHIFSNLRTDKNRNRYPSVTTHRAPHKPLLLLSIMDLIAQGQITENFIEPSYELVEAAHIIPWNESHDDLPTNGMALCRLCHWSFDEGMMSVGKNYEVMVSRRVQTEQNLPGHILTLRDRNIFTPGEERFRPSQDNLDFHRRKYFRA